MMLLMIIVKKRYDDDHLQTFLIIKRASLVASDPQAFLVFLMRFSFPGQNCLSLSYKKEKKINRRRKEPLLSQQENRHQDMKT